MGRPMNQRTGAHQNPIGIFSDQQTAESALKTLEESGVSSDRMSLVPRSLDPNPAVQDTEAAYSARGGAILGTLLGATVGLLLGGIGLSPAGWAEFNSLGNLIGVVMLASGVGAAAGGIIAALAGASVHKGSAEPQSTAMSQQYLLLMNGSVDELSNAQEVLQKQGYSIQ